MFQPPVAWLARRLSRALHPGGGSLHSQAVNDRGAQARWLASFHAPAGDTDRRVDAIKFVPHSDKSILRAGLASAEQPPEFGIWGLAREQVACGLCVCFTPRKGRCPPFCRRVCGWRAMTRIILGHLD
jgi:hypothetical protein